MKLTAFLILILFAVVMFPITVKAAENDFFLELAVDSPYYLRGDTSTITVSSKPLTSYTLMVFNPLNESVTKRQRETDAYGFDSFNLPIGPTLKSGTYTVIANTSEHVSTTWTTIVETTGYSQTTFPVTWQHKNVNYTIVAKGFRATSDSGNITVQYPSLPVSFQVNLFVNNMTVVERLHNSQLGIHIDLTYLFIHAGMKLVINGSIPQPTTYSFKFPSPQRLKHKLDRISDGYLIFDWSDLRKTAQQCSYNHDTGMLTVDVPQTFSIDPYVFESGLETNDLSEWDGTETSGATINVSSTRAYSGTYSLRASGMDGGDYASAYKDFASPPSTVYSRFYMQLDYCNIGAGGYAYIAGMRDITAGQSFFEFGVNEDLDVRIKYRDYASGDVVDTSTENTLTNDTWYCVEMKYVKSTTVGEYRVYIDGVEDTSLTHTGLDTRYDMERWRTWRVASAVTSARCYWDCFIISESYVGPETGNTAPTIGEFACDSTVYANKYSLVNATIDDADGVADFENCTIQLNGTIQLKWINSTNTFSELADASNYCTLDPSNSVKTTVNSTAVKLSWKIKLYWNYTEGSIFINGTVFDDEPESGTGGPSSLFTFEDDLIVCSVSHSPPEPEDGQTFTVTGQLYYTGTSTAPEDGTGITVKLWKAGFIVASTTTVTTGQFSISHSEPEAGEYYYTVYSQTDEASTQNQTERVDVVKGGSSSSYTPPSDSTPENNETTSDTPVGFTPSQTQGNLNISPVIVVGIIAVGIVIASAYTQTSNLKVSRKQWKKNKKKKKNTKWKEKKAPNIDWKKGDAWE